MKIVKITQTYYIGELGIVDKPEQAKKFRNTEEAGYAILDYAPGGREEVEIVEVKNDNPK